MVNDLYLSGSLFKTDSQYPLYDNGLIIQNGDTQDNMPIDPTSDIWYIQQGFKRKLGRNSGGTSTNGYWKRLLRQVEGEIVFNEDGSLKPLKNSPNFKFLSYL